MRAPRLPCACGKNTHDMGLVSGCSAKLALSMDGCFSGDLLLLLSWVINVACIAGLLCARPAHSCLVLGMASSRPCFVQIVPKSITSGTTLQS